MTSYNVLLYRCSWILPKGMRFPAHLCSAVTCVSPTIRDRDQWATGAFSRVPAERKGRNRANQSQFSTIPTIAA